MWSVFLFINCKVYPIAGAVMSKEQIQTQSILWPYRGSAQDETVV